MHSILSEKLNNGRLPEELSRRFSEPAWLREKRLSGFEMWRETPFPTRRDEYWRYTDIGKHDWGALGMPGEASGFAESEVLESALTGLEKFADESAVVIHCDGAPCCRRVPKSWEGQGVSLLDWQSAVAEMPELLEEHWMSEVLPSGYDKFTALHSALVSAAVILHVPRGVVLDEPLVNVQWYGGSGNLHVPHLLVVLEESAGVRIVEIIRGSGGENTIIPAYEFILGANASLKYARLQEAEETNTILGYQRVSAGRDSNSMTAAINLGGKLVRDTIHVRFAGEGANADMLGAYLGGASQHFDHETLQEHAAPRCHSNLLFKGALSGDARAVFNGMISVSPGAQKTDAYQTNRNLLLSKGARADSVPRLEILADDVRCSHGATVSMVSEAQVFYLMSRGLSRSEAEELIVFGFVGDVLSRLEWQELAPIIEKGFVEKIRSW